MRITAATPAVIYCAAHSGVTPGNGFPVVAGQDLPVTTTGELWACQPAASAADVIAYVFSEYDG